MFKKCFHKIFKNSTETRSKKYPWKSPALLVLIIKLFALVKVQVQDDLIQKIRT